MHAIPATADSSPKIVKARRNVNTSSSPTKLISTPGTERILGLYTLRPDVRLACSCGSSQGRGFCRGANVTIYS